MGAVWPLSVKEIYSMVSKEYGLAVTYQAVHKCIAELEAENVVHKEGSKYKLNKEWIQNLKQIATNLENNYVTPYKVKLDFSKQNPIILKFDD